MRELGNGQARYEPFVSTACKSRLLQRYIVASIISAFLARLNARGASVMLGYLLVASAGVYVEVLVISRTIWRALGHLLNTRQTRSGGDNETDEA